MGTSKTTESERISTRDSCQTRGDLLQLPPPSYGMQNIMCSQARTEEVLVPIRRLYSEAGSLANKVRGVERLAIMAGFYITVTPAGAAGRFQLGATWKCDG